MKTILLLITLFLFSCTSDCFDCAEMKKPECLHFKSAHKECVLHGGTFMDCKNNIQRFIKIYGCESLAKENYNGYSESN